MSLLDADDQPILEVLVQKNPSGADSMGIALHSLVSVRQINGRLSRPSMMQQGMMGTLMIEGEYTLYTYDGNIDNGMFISSPEDGRLFRVVAPRNKYYTEGAIDSYTAYRVQEVTSQVIQNTSNTA